MCYFYQLIHEDTRSGGKAEAPGQHALCREWQGWDGPSGPGLLAVRPPPAPVSSPMPHPRPPSWHASLLHLAKSTREYHRGTELTGLFPAASLQLLTAWHTAGAK